MAVVGPACRPQLQVGTQWGDPTRSHPLTSVLGLGTGRNHSTLLFLGHGLLLATLASTSKGHFSCGLEHKSGALVGGRWGKSGREKFMRQAQVYPQRPREAGV